MGHSLHTLQEDFRNFSLLNGCKFNLILFHYCKLNQILFHDFILNLICLEREGGAHISLLRFIKLLCLFERIYKCLDNTENDWITECLH